MYYSSGTSIWALLSGFLIDKIDKSPNKQNLIMVIAMPMMLLISRSFCGKA